MNIIKSNKENIRIVANNAARPTTGKSDVFYYTLDNNLLWRWSDSAYVEVPFSFVKQTTTPDQLYGTDSSGNQTTYNASSLGIDTFLELTDTPANYTGSGTYLVRVNATGDALEFVNPTTIIPAQVILTPGTGITVSGTYPNLTITNSSPNATHTGDVTGSTALTIAANAVNNTKAADMPANTIKGNNTGSTADPKDLTVGEAQALLGINPNAEQNVQADWNETNISSDAYIKNKPDLSSAMTYKGTKINIAALLADTGPHKVGDVWNVDGDGAGHNYAFSGTPGSGATVIGDWDKLSGTIDLSNYYTQTQTNNLLNNKVDKVATNNQIYGTTSGGAQTTYTIGTSVNNIPQRHAGGQIQVPATPTANTDAASKQYVDSQIATTKVESWGVDLRDNNVLNFFTVENIQITSPTVINGSGTLTITNGGSAYTLGTTITSGNEIVITSSADSVWKITVTTV